MYIVFLNIDNSETVFHKLLFLVLIPSSFRYLEIFRKPKALSELVYKSNTLNTISASLGSIIKSPRSDFLYP